MATEELTLNEFQEAARRTMGSNNIACNALGLTGEAGEYADLIKKHLFHKHPLDKLKGAKELGDVLWYVAAAAENLGFSLSEIAQMNIDKLRARYPDGFSPEASLARADENAEKLAILAAAHGVG
jgi:NTP pyrophosphatase (non-canonical NTP hydrolase)